jgi:hypothetical protein
MSELSLHCREGRIIRFQGFLLLALLLVSALTLWAAASSITGEPVVMDQANQSMELSNFNVIVLPDTQFYSESYPTIFDSQTQWIVDTAGDLNTVFVSHEGDVVDNAGVNLEWQRADSSLSVLDGVVPWAVLPGNHDGTNVGGSGENLGNYNSYFGFGRFSGQPWYGGAYNEVNSNSFELFSGGYDDFLIFHFQYHPSDAVLAWANIIISQYPYRRVIVTTHDYMELEGERSEEGNHIWNNFVFPNADQVFLVLCGHNHGEASRSDIVDGHVVYQLLADYQDPSNGGNGWLRILDFQPAEDKIYVKTYSPYLDDYQTDDDSQFVLHYDMTSQMPGGRSGYVALGPADPNLTSPSGNYRWMDVADQVYSSGFQENYRYAQANVHVSYDVVGESLVGELVALNLKPNFAYQLKIAGTFGFAGNERVGLGGRWWEQVWTGLDWSVGSNLNDKGDGSYPNPNDFVYFARRDILDGDSDTGFHYKYSGYLVFAYFITDGNGDTTFSFETGSCFHVLWKTSQRAPGVNDGPVNDVSFDPEISFAYDFDYGSQTVGVFGEWERLPMGGVDLAVGEYDCGMVLTEESFHGSGLSGNWAAAMTGGVAFNILEQPNYAVHLLLTGEPNGAVYQNGQELILNVSVFNDGLDLVSNLALCVTGPERYGFYDIQPIGVAVGEVREYSFCWKIPAVAGKYVVEVGLVPSKLTAYDVVWFDVS